MLPNDGICIILQSKLNLNFYYYRLDQASEQLESIRVDFESTQNAAQRAQASAQAAQQAAAEAALAAAAAASAVNSVNTHTGSSGTNNNHQGGNYVDYYF